MTISVAEVLGCLERRKAVQLALHWLAVDREALHCVAVEIEGS